MPKFRGCAIFQTRVIRQKVSLKIIVSSMERLQHGDRKPVETSEVYFGSLKTLILYAKLENIRIGTSINILTTQNSKTIECFRARNLLPRNNNDVTHCEKTLFFIQNKAVYGAESSSG